MSNNTSKNLLIVSLLAVMTGVAVFAVMKMDTTGKSGNRLGATFEYDLSKEKQIDPALYGYHEAQRWSDKQLQGLGGLAVDAGGQVWVVCNQKLLILSEKLEWLKTIPFAAEAWCLAIATDKTVYTGCRNKVIAVDDSGKFLTEWILPGEKSLITSIAAGANDVLVADMGNRIILRYDRQGTLKNRIGAKDEARTIAGFITPSPYLDMALGYDGLLWAVNPGHHRLEAYTLDGDKEYEWGAGGMDLDKFCGCCNPSHFALLPDGRFVTAEKGLTRIKVYNADGQMQCVVAGPAEFVEHDRKTGEMKGELDRYALEVAVSRQGDVYVFDPVMGEVRRFVAKASGSN